MNQYSNLSAIVNLDWLAFSIRLIPSIFEKENHTWILENLEPYGYKVIEYPGTNVYKRRAIIYNAEGEKMITLLFDPHSRVIPYDSCLVEVANKWLYSSHVLFYNTEYSKHSLAWVLDLIQHVHFYRITNLSRIDICADFQCSDKQYEFIRRLADNTYYVQKYREGSMFHDYKPSDYWLRAPKCLSWGSKRSNVKWKLYNKSLEVFEWVKEGDKMVKYCHKPYIVDEWRESGFDVDKVWRLEVSITPAEKYLFHDKRISYGNITNQFYIDDLFISLYQNRFVCRRNQGHKDRTNDERVFLLPNQGLTDRLRVAPPKDSREIAEYVSCLRSAMLQLSKPEVQVNDQMKRLWMSTAESCVYIGRLEKYFHDTYGKPIDRIEEVISENLQTTTT